MLNELTIHILYINQNNSFLSRDVLGHQPPPKKKKISDEVEGSWGRQDTSAELIFCQQLINESISCSEKNVIKYTLQSALALPPLQKHIQHNNNVINCAAAGRV